MKLFEVPIVARNIWHVARAILFPQRPFLAHVVIIRRCNLSCHYCNEFDKHSEPAPLPEVQQWIDKLAELGTAHVTVSGGEPTLHPDLDQIIKHIRRRKMLTGLITNGARLDLGLIKMLNEAGLEFLQLSIDNVYPDSGSQKSLILLGPTLELLSLHARFRINVNCVLGTGPTSREDALEIARRCRELGFVFTVGIAHDTGGQSKPLSAHAVQVFDELQKMKRRHGLDYFLNPLQWRRFNRFQENLARGLPNEWRCRAGARYLYICEHGKVQRCSQQRGTPNIALSEYGARQIETEYYLEKPCAPHCTLGCVQRTALLDNWRGRQWSETPRGIFNLTSRG